MPEIATQPVLLLAGVAIIIKGGDLLPLYTFRAGASFHDHARKNEVADELGKLLSRKPASGAKLMKMGRKSRNQSGAGEGNRSHSV